MPTQVRLFQLFAFVSRLELWEPVYVLFLLQRGFSLAQYGLLDTMWYVGSVLFEVPTGALADRLGNRASLLLALVSQALSFALIASARSFWAMAAAFLLWGLASAFETGTYSAFLYDSLKEAGREGDYGVVYGRTATLQILASALGALIGGYVGGIRLQMPLWASAAIPLLLCPLVWSFREPQVERAVERSYGLQIRESLRYVLQRPLVTVLLLYWALMGAVVWALRMFYQPLLDSYGVPVPWIGMLYLGSKLCMAAGSHVSGAVLQRLGVTTLYAAPVVLVVAVLGVGGIVSPWVIGLIFVIFLVEGLYTPALNTLLNQRIPSGKRATIISLAMWVSCLISTAVNTPLGRIADVVSLQAAFTMIGVGTLVSMAVVVARLRREAAAA
jgi:MFS family permease